MRAASCSCGQQTAVTFAVLRSRPRPVSSRESPGWNQILHAVMKWFFFLDKDSVFPALCSRLLRREEALVLCRS